MKRLINVALLATLITSLTSVPVYGQEQSAEGSSSENNLLQQEQIEEHPQEPEDYVNKMEADLSACAAGYSRSFNQFRTASAEAVTQSHRKFTHSATYGFLNDLLDKSHYLYYSCSADEAKWAYQELREYVQATEWIPIQFTYHNGRSCIYIGYEGLMYLYPRTACIKMWDRYGEIIADQVSQYINTSGSESQIVDSILDYLQKFYNYSPAQRSVWDSITDRSANCFNYSMIFCDMCLSLGIDATCAGPYAVVNAEDKLGCFALGAGARNGNIYAYNWLEPEQTPQFSDDNSDKPHWTRFLKRWFYYDANMDAVTGWQKIDGAWYCFNSNGILQTGWVQWDGDWYYFDSTGQMKTGWMELPWEGRTDWYYFYSDGTLARNTTIQGCYVNGSGAWVK